MHENRRQRSAASCYSFFIIRVCAFDSGQPVLAIRCSAFECVRLTTVSRFLPFVSQHASVRLTAVRRFLLFVFQHASVCVRHRSAAVFDSGLPLLLAIRNTKIKTKTKANTNARSAFEYWFGSGFPLFDWYMFAYA